MRGALGRQGRKWIGSAGCLMLILCCGGCTALFFQPGDGPADAILQGAIAQAGADSQVVGCLGWPIKPGPVLPGSRWSGVKLEGPALGYVALPSPIKTHAVIDLPIVGPNGSGVIQGHAFRSNGAWYFENLNVHLPCGGPVRVVQTPTKIQVP